MQLFLQKGTYKTALINVAILLEIKYKKNILKKTCWIIMHLKGSNIKEGAHWDIQYSSFLKKTKL